jgi:hypothetical protein
MEDDQTALNCNAGTQWDEEIGMRNRDLPMQRRMIKCTARARALREREREREKGALVREDTKNEGRKQHEGAQRMNVCLKLLLLKLSSLKMYARD